MTEQGAATQEIARSVEIAAKRTVETADEVSRVGDATDRHPRQRRHGASRWPTISATSPRRIRAQVDAVLRAAARGLSAHVASNAAGMCRGSLPRRDQHRVEADVAVGVVGMRGEPGFGRRGDARAAGAA